MKRQELYRTHAPPEQETAISGQRLRPPAQYLSTGPKFYHSHTQNQHFRWKLDSQISALHLVVARIKQTQHQISRINRSFSASHPHSHILNCENCLDSVLARRRYQAGSIAGAILLVSMDSIDLQRRPIRPRSSLAS